jgi:hypothetical protein
MKCNLAYGATMEKARICVEVNMELLERALKALLYIILMVGVNYYYFV